MNNTVNSFYQRAVYKVNPKSWTTITLPTTANYFHLANMGDGTLYFASSRIPTPDSYDMKIPAGSARMYVEPTKRPQVYVYNNAAQEISFALMFFAAEFDPLVLAMSTLEVGGGSSSGASGGSSFDGVVKGFETSLPSGANTIGKVDLNTNTQLANILTQLKAATPAGSNLIGKVDINNSAQLTNILTALNKPVYGLFSSGNATSAGVTVTATSGRKITCIALLSNDGDTDITVTIGAAVFTLKSGEVLDNFNVYADSIKVAGNSVPYRLAYNEKEV